MNYREFINYKNNIIENNDDIVDLSSTNIYKTYNIEKKFIDVIGHVNGNIHRCHLVENWLDLCGISHDFKSQIGTSTGVRDSLSILVDEFKKKNWTIPKDVYPFYQNLFNEKDVQYNEYTTLTNDSLFDDLGDADCLLLTYPLKPLGRDLSSNEINIINDWLNYDSNRRLFIDAVYFNGFDQSILNNLFQLFEGDQTFLLFSLSKSFLLPNVFGVTFLPNKDLLLRNNFKNLKPLSLNLNLAFQALNTSDLNRQSKILSESLFDKYLRLESLLKKEGIDIPLYNGGYLVYNHDNSHDKMLEKGILSIPESVFGGTGNGVVFSSL